MIEVIERYSNEKLDFISWWQGDNQVEVNILIPGDRYDASLMDRLFAIEHQLCSDYPDIVFEFVTIQPDPPS